MKTNSDGKQNSGTDMDQALDSVLEQLRSEHRAMEAPEHLTAFLLAETERQASLKQPANNPFEMIWAWGLSLALLAGLIWGLTAWKLRKAEVDPQREVRSVTPQGPVAPATHPPVAASAGIGIRGPNRASAKVKKEEAEPSMDDFLALPDSDGLPPTSAVSLVRMRIAAGSLQQYGLDVPEGAGSQTLVAEFVVGEDGLPRAIRIIP
jgi:hypothetical protein